MTGTEEGKLVAGEVACLVALVFMVVAVAGLQTELAPEKGRRQLAVSQWSLVTPHHPYWEPGVPLVLHFCF
jgi:hypothetical protein